MCVVIHYFVFLKHCNPIDSRVSRLLYFILVAFLFRIYTNNLVLLCSGDVVNNCKIQCES